MSLPVRTLSVFCVLGSRGETVARALPTRAPWIHLSACIWNLNTHPPYSAQPAHRCCIAQCCGGLHQYVQSKSTSVPLKLNRKTSTHHVCRSSSRHLYLCTPICFLSHSLIHLHGLGRRKRRRGCPRMTSGPGVSQWSGRLHF